MAAKHFPQAQIVLARAIYPTAWGQNGAPYEPRSALQHTRRAVSALEKAGWTICRNRLGAGHAVPDTAALLEALRLIRDEKGDADDLRKIADRALQAAAER